MQNGTSQPNAIKRLAEDRNVSVMRKSSTQTENQSDNLQAASHEDLQAEIARLQVALKTAQTTGHIDQISGLPNRGAFLDQANAEFNRCRRYDHDLTLCVTDIVGLDRIAHEHGQAAADHIVTCISQMCLSSSRFGVDLLGRISDNQIAIMLPETPLPGGLQFLARMQKIITSMPIYLEREQIKPGIKVSADALHKEDTSFMDLFNRTWRRTGVGVKASDSQAA